MTTPKVNTALRITDQYRDYVEGGMVYELRCGDARLALRAAQSKGPGDPEWRFEARTTQSPQLVILGDWRGSRAVALETLARSWNAKVPLLGIPSFDWGAIAAALAAVRAV
jgi:hypothetical protein